MWLGFQREPGRERTSALMLSLIAIHIGRRPIVRNSGPANVGSSVHVDGTGAIDDQSAGLSDTVDAPAGISPASPVRECFDV